MRLHVFLCDFHLLILTLLTWSRPRRQAGLKTTGVAGTCKHKVIIFVASVSALLVNATVVKQLFLQCSSLERASRSLAKTGLFFCFFSIFCFCFFSVRFWGVLEGTFGVRRVLWVSFGTHFGINFVTF